MAVASGVCVGDEACCMCVWAVSITSRDSCLITTVVYACVRSSSLCVSQREGVVVCVCCQVRDTSLMSSLNDDAETPTR